MGQGAVYSNCDFLINSMRHFGLSVNEVQNDADFILLDLDCLERRKILNLIDFYPAIKIYGISSSINKQQKYNMVLDGVFSKEQSFTTILNFVMGKDGSCFELYDVKLLKALLRGLGDKAIAHEENIPLSTVKYYLRRLYRKLEVSNRVQAALAATQIDV